MLEHGFIGQPEILLGSEESWGYCKPSYSAFLPLSYPYLIFYPFVGNV